MSIRVTFILLLLSIRISAGAEEDGPWAVYGSIVSVDGAKDGWIVFDDSGISAMFCTEKEIPENARRIKHDGYVFPALIDAHNHAHWNAMPQWRAGRTFESRYKWLVDNEYKTKVEDVYYTN